MASKKNAVKKQSKNATVLKTGALLVPNQMMKVKGKKTAGAKDAAFKFPTRKSVKAEQKLLKQEQSKTEPKFGMTVAQARKAMLRKQPITHRDFGNGIIVSVPKVKSPTYVGFAHPANSLTHINARLAEMRILAPVDTEVVMTDDGLVEVAASYPIAPIVKSPLKVRSTFADLPLLTGFKTSLAHTIGGESMAFVKVGNSTAIRTIVRVSDGDLTISLNNVNSMCVRSSEKERFKKTQPVYPIVAIPSKDDATLVP